jgi:PST family polysaccharide transporter
MKFKDLLRSLNIFKQTSLGKISGNVSWLFLDKVLKIIIGLFVSAWVTRYLGPSLFGVLSFGLAFAALFMPLSSMGLPNIVVRNIVRKPENKSEYLGTALIIQLITSIVSYGLSILIIFLIKPADQLQIIVVAIFSGMLVFRAWGDTFNYWFQSQIQSKYTVWSNIIASAIVAIIRISLILLQAPLLAFAGAMLFEIVLASGIITYYYLSQNEKLSLWKFNLQQARSLLADSWPLLLSSMAVVIYMKIDQIMLGSLVSNVDLGIYSAAVQLSEIWYFIPVAIASSFFPAVINTREKHSKNEYEFRMQMLFDLMVVTAYVIMILVVIFAPWIVSVLYGEDYIETGRILQIHILAFVFVSLGVARSNWLLAENYVKFSMFVTILGAVINILLNLVLIPRYAGLGAAWSTVLSYGISAFFSSALSNKVRKIFYQQSLALLIPFRIRSLWISVRDLLSGQHIDEPKE